MKVAACLLVGMDAPSAAVARSAVRVTFPQSIITILNTVEEALKCVPTPGGELLLLANPDPRSARTAVEATDATGLRRWAIVVLGAIPAIEGGEIVSAPDWGEQLLPRAMQSAVAQYELLRENGRLHGDLRTLAYRITHDLRTPLGGILSAGETLKESLAERDPASEGLAKPLFDSVDDLGKLIDRVSVVTKASVSPVAKKTVAMGEVVWAVLQRQERQILQQNAAVVQPDSWPEVEGVPAWLEEVWGNLLSNALQHGNSPPHIELGWSRNKNEFRFWVSDNGAGISPEKRDDLFQPFHLLHRSNARKGLGLSMVQRLVELQGGQCGYEPSAAGGSTFFFTLPFVNIVRD